MLFRKEYDRPINNTESLQALALPRKFAWYKGILVSQIAGEANTNGAFDLVVSKMRRGTEPPPHVHSRADEFFYVLNGNLNIYAEGQILEISTGECVFLPKGKPHAFLIRSEEIDVLALMTPGGFLNAVNKRNAPAERMQLPSEDALTYLTTDLTETMKVFKSTVSVSFLQRR